MKQAIIITLLALVSLSANAAKYECSLSDGSTNDPQVVTFEFDTATEDNKFVGLGDGTSVGCVVIRATPQLISCGVGDEINFSLFVAAEDGTSVLALASNSHGVRSKLSCIKNK